MHDFPAPARETHHVLDGRNGLLVTVGGMHAPPHVFSWWKWQERGSAIPLACAECPRESKEIDGKARVDESPKGQ